MIDDRTMHAQIELGNEADTFFSSQIGQYVLGRCNQIISTAKDKLSIIDSKDSDEIRRLQNEIWKAGAVPAFLNELLAEGRQALETIQSTDDYVED